MITRTSIFYYTARITVINTLGEVARSSYGEIAVVVTLEYEAGEPHVFEYSCIYNQYGMVVADNPEHDEHRFALHCSILGML